MSSRPAGPSGTRRTTRRGPDATRRPRGRAHLAVMATTAAGAERARDWLTRAHAEIPRVANARRKFAHRFVRLIDQLARSFAERAASGPTEALDRLRAILGEAVASTGVGFHVELAGEQARGLLQHGGLDQERQVLGAVGRTGEQRDIRHGTSGPVKPVRVVSCRV